MPTVGSTGNCCKFSDHPISNYTDSKISDWIQKRKRNHRNEKRDQSKMGCLPDAAGPLAGTAAGLVTNQYHTCQYKNTVKHHQHSDNQTLVSSKSTNHKI